MGQGVASGRSADNPVPAEITSPQILHVRHFIGGAQSSGSGSRSSHSSSPLRPSTQQAADRRYDVVEARHPSDWAFPPVECTVFPLLDYIIYQLQMRGSHKKSLLRK